MTLTRRHVLAAGVVGLGGAGLALAKSRVWTDTGRSGAVAIPSAPSTNSTRTAPASSTSPQQRPAPVSTFVDVLCRDSWRARPLTGEGRSHVVEQITVHHSAVVLADNGLVPERIRGYQRDHQAKHWVDLAYHYVIDAHGNIYEGRPVRLVGDTSTGYDPAGHFQAMCDGNFEEQEIPDRQFDALVHLLAFAATEFSVPLDAISGHRDRAPTACPGRSLYERVRTGELVDRVATVFAEPPMLRLVCGQDAADRIARIEARTDTS